MQFTVAALNARFAGKMVDVFYLGIEKNVHTGICKKIQGTSESKYPDQMYIELEDGSRYGFVPDTQTFDSIEGGGDCHSTFRRKIQIVVSLKDSADRKAALEAEAKKVWMDLAEELALRIPESCRKLADDKGWYKGELDGFWLLPKYLEDMVHNTKGGSCNSDKFYVNDLQQYGFQNFDHLEIKFKELEQAWAGLVRIEVRKGEGYRVQVCYYAVEFEEKKNKPTV